MKEFITKKEVMGISEVPSVCKIGTYMIHTFHTTHDTIEKFMELIDSPLIDKNSAGFKLEMATLQQGVEQLKLALLTNEYIRGDVAVVFIDQEYIDKFPHDVILDMFKHEVGHIHAKQQPLLLKLTHQGLNRDIKLSTRLEIEADSYTSGSIDFIMSTWHLVNEVLSGGKVQLTETDKVKYVNNTNKELLARFKRLGHKSAFVPVSIS